eukprot:487023_1
MKQHNCIIDIDDVNQEPGEGYENWTKIARKKLNEREDKIMSIRVIVLETIINRKCKEFETINSIKNNATIHNFKVNDEIVNECLMKLGLCLELWNGVSLTKTKKSLSTFRQYFIAAKKWFDVKKKQIIGPVFWIKLFDILKQFTINCSLIYVNNNYKHLQKLYSDYLLFNIISGIFLGELSGINSKKSQPLISCAMLKDCYSMKQYLGDLHDSLNVKEGICATEIYKRVNKQLIHLTNQCYNEFKKHFKNEMLNVNACNVNTNCVNTKIRNRNVNMVPNMNTQNMNTQNMNMNMNSNSNIGSNIQSINMNSIQHIIVPPNMNIINNNISNSNGIYVSQLSQLSGYNIIHSAPQNVISYRYNPMYNNMINCNNYNHNYNNYNGNNNVIYNNNQSSLLSLCLSLIKNNQ